MVWIGLIRDSWGTHTHMLNVWHIYHKFRLNVGNYAIHWASGISKNLFLIWGSLQISKPQAANSFGVPNSIAFDEVFKESLKVDVRFVDVFFLWMFCCFADFGFDSNPKVAEECWHRRCRGAVSGFQMGSSPRWNLKTKDSMRHMEISLETNRSRWFQWVYMSHI